MIYRIFKTNYIDSKVYNFIDPSGKNLFLVAWVIRASYNHILVFMSGQVMFGRYMLFNVMPIVDWCVVTARKQRKFDIYNARENNRQVRHEYTLGNIVYVEKTGIHRKLYYKNTDRIESLKSSQNVPLDSRGEL